MSDVHLRQTYMWKPQVRDVILQPINTAIFFFFLKIIIVLKKTHIII